MENTQFLTQLFGVWSLVMGIALLRHRKEMNQALDGLLKSMAAIYMVGMLELLAGLSVVLTHNVWDYSLNATIVTLFGWLMVIESVTLLLAPKEIVAFTKKFRSPGMFNTSGFIAIIIGLYLGYVGFFA